MLVVLLFCTLSLVQGFVEHIPAIVDQQWNTMNRTGPAYVITEDDWITFYHRYMTSASPGYNVDVNEDDFLEGFWLEFQRTLPEVRGYFRIFDLHQNTFLRITEFDINLMHSRCDEDWDGLLNETEFRYGYSGLMRPIPWAVMFINYDTDGSEEINRSEMNALFNDWGAIFDGNATLFEFDYFWTANGYGDSVAAERSFNTLDFNDDNLITDTDIDDLYFVIDENTNGRFDFDEFTEIDFLVNGWP